MVRTVGVDSRRNEGRWVPELRMMTSGGTPAPSEIDAQAAHQATAVQSATPSLAPAPMAGLT